MSIASRTTTQRWWLAALASLMSAAAGCATPVVRRPEDLLAAGDLRGALRNASSATAATRARIAHDVIHRADPILTLSAVSPDELAATAGIHSLRHIDPSWAFVRARFTHRPGARAAGHLTGEVAITSDARPVLTLSHDLKTYASLTSEPYPRDLDHWQIATGDFPLPVHVLTFGILSVLSLHVEHHYEVPPIERVQAAVPRALRLSDSVTHLCGGDCTILIVRRPERDDVPLEIHAVATVENEGATPISFAATIAVPVGGRLEDRLARAATELHLEAAPGGEAAFGMQAPVKTHCDNLLDVQLRLSDCAKIKWALWPTHELTPYRIALPPVPEQLGTPRSSAAARPDWSDAEYAPNWLSPLPDPSLPVPDAVEGGLLSCVQKALRVPGEDSDRVYATVTLGKRSWRVRSDDLTLPLLSLKPKAALDISFYDTDILSGDDYLGTLTLRRKGAEMSASIGTRDNLRRAWLAMDCRVFGRAAVEASFADAYAHAVDALDLVEEVPIVVDPGRDDFGAGKTGMPGARAAITRCAGLVGWDDPRVQALIARLSGLDMRFWAGVRQSIEGMKSDANGAIVIEAPKVPELEVRRVRLDCGDALKPRLRRSLHVSLRDYDPAWLASACAVRISVTNAGTTRAFSSAVDHAQLILDDGRAIALSVLDFAEIAPGASVELAAFPKSTPPRESRGATPWKLTVRTFNGLAILPIPYR